MVKPPALLLVMLAVACAPPPSVGVLPEPAPAAGAAAYPRDLLWVRTSAEHTAAFLQTFRAAREKLTEQARDRQRGTWAVIVDADETLLDNSEYQRRLHVTGSTFDNGTWNAWVREGAAAALPGAVEYVGAVRALGGRVVVVTNRDEEVCDATRENFAALQFAIDLVLCRAAASDKNPRFESVQAGTTGSGLPALQVLQWVGDNIQDFPRMTQAVRSARSGDLALFGERYWVLPNPMYGSFERNVPE